jgi:hypothetical protein
LFLFTFAEPNNIKYQVNIMNNTDEDNMLTPHFSKWEMMRSGTAIRQGICNEPNAEQWKNLKALCLNILEPLRQRFGAIIITSGFRCKRLNELVGGVINSQHCRGEAADIYIGSTEKAVKYFKFLREKTDFDELIAEPTSSYINEAKWFHVSYTTRRLNRHRLIFRAR